MADFSQISVFLSAISSIAVIAGTVFIVFQLRQNAKLIEAGTMETRMNMSLALLEKLTDESFAKRRKKMHEVVRKYGKKNWAGFDDSLDDFEARNFAYIYELLGQLIRDGILDGPTVMNALQYLVVFDWNAFAPLSNYLMRRYKLRVNAWQNFEWLAQETRQRMEERERVASTVETT